MIQQQNVEAVHTHTHTRKFIKIFEGYKAFIDSAKDRLF